MAIALTLSNVAHLQDTTTSQTTINHNSSGTVSALQDGLSRSGHSPNAMGASLDMNGHRILNLSAPGGPTEPIRLADFTATPNTTLAFGAPTSLVGTAAVSGSASTTIHSDGAPAIDQAMSPTWTGTHTFTKGIVGVYVPAFVTNDGITDDQPAIQAAINSLPVTGGTVLIVPATGSTGPCNIGNSINLGDSDGTFVSTRMGVYLKGSVVPGSPQFNDDYPQPLVLKWTGASGGNMIQINGPLAGWGLENLSLDCNGTADSAVQVFSGQFGRVDNVNGFNFQFAGIYSKSVVPFGGHETDCLHNVWINTQWYSNVAASKGIFLTGQSGGSNTDYNTFIDTYVSMVGAGCIGIDLQACDSNTFYNTQIGGGTTTEPIVFDYTVNADWPASNSFYGVDYATVGGMNPDNDGSPSVDARPNRIFGLITTNGASYVTLPNLSWQDMASVTFAGLPGTAYEGMQQTITNSNTNTWGANITGTGAFKVLAQWNGTNWTVIGK